MVINELQEDEELLESYKKAAEKKLKEIEDQIKAIIIIKIHLL